MDQHVCLTLTNSIPQAQSLATIYFSTLSLQMSQQTPVKSEDTDFAVQEWCRVSAATFFKHGDDGGQLPLHFMKSVLEIPGMLGISAVFEACIRRELALAAELVRNDRKANVRAHVKAMWTFPRRGYAPW
jgi:hypothetical protein